MDADIAYANGDFIPDAMSYPPRWADDARAFREIEATIGRARLNEPYGPHPREALDLFLPAGRPEGVLVFVHGGYWRAFGRETWSHFAKGAQARGWAVAMPSYPLAPEVRISEITGSIVGAIGRTAELVPKGPIHLTGHSAGGHLVLRMVCADVGQPPEVAARIKRVLTISPLSDLRPLIATKMNHDFRLDAVEAEAESPVLLDQADGPRVISWVGAEERPAFLEQARWITEAWNAELRVAPGRHHFDVIDDLMGPDSPMIRALLD